jgi:hypothetical protein
VKEWTEWLKQPCENWRFKVEFRLPLLFYFLAQVNTIANLKDKIILMGKAFDNERQHLDGPFILHNNGNLIRDIVFHQLPTKMMIIELCESNIQSVAVLNQQIKARERSAADLNAFQPWSVTGYVRDDPNRIIRLVLKNSSGFYIVSPKL